jgi:hypothetical protein
MQSDAQFCQLLLRGSFGSVCVRRTEAQVLAATI